MKARVLKNEKSLRISEIMNESQLETFDEVCEKTGIKQNQIVVKDFGCTRDVITENRKQFNLFVCNWNS